MDVRTAVGGEFVIDECKRCEFCVKWSGKFGERGEELAEEKDESDEERGES